MKQGPATEILYLPATLTAAAVARQRVAEVCHGLDEGLRYVADLLTTELVSNAVRHSAMYSASGGGIVLGIRRDERLLRVEVSDPDPRPLGPVRRPSEPRESGWGLYLVSELSNDWGSRPTESGDGKVVWFELQVPGSG